jgi:PKD repeat protein
MNRGKVFNLGLVTVMAFCVTACTLTDVKAPPLQGPSELALSLGLAANPDVLSQDGASQSHITIDARDAYGQPVANLPIRAEIMVNSTFVDFGSLSARTLVTGTNGRASLTYTAPSTIAGAPPNTTQTVDIRVTPSGTDATSQIGRFISIRLVPPGTIVAGGPTPSFTFSPTAPVAFQDVVFTSTSTPALGSAIVNYAWAFGDGGTASGAVVTHRFSSGTYSVTLTTTDSNGISASIIQAVTVGAGSVPTAAFTMSPSSGAGVNQTIFFNASPSTAGSGRSLVRYAWDFGTGSTASGITVGKSFDEAGSYTVTLTVTDDVGQTARATNVVTVTGGALSAAFTISPTNPRPGTTILYDGRSSIAAPGTTIQSYAWEFGDGDTGTGATASNSYPSALTYTVRLTVTDSLGRTATTTMAITVVP